MDPTGAAPLRPTDRREIGPYRLLGRLGEGGMGTVFLARAPTERLVAVKVVKAEYANQQGFADRFHAEVENARRVASFCTAEVLDNGNADDGRPYMVTEFIAGTPLSEQIAQYGQLDPGTLHGVALGVAAALAAIHNAGLVHRDLKPANVILSLSGPRVIDFGIARALDRDSGFTMSGELLGSPGWWAPEQVRGSAITPAADIFSWGCMVAYAANGRHPYGRGDVITMATRVLNNPPDLGVLPAPLNDLVRQATAMEPAARPNAPELVLALVGGGARRPVDPPTMIATEMLNQSWQPPENVVKDTGAFPKPKPKPKLSRRERKKAEQAALERQFHEAVGHTPAQTTSPAQPQAGNPGQAGGPAQAVGPPQAGGPAQAGRPGQAGGPAQAGRPGQAGGPAQAQAAGSAPAQAAQAAGPAMGAASKPDQHESLPGTHGVPQQGSLPGGQHGSLPGTQGTPSLPGSQGMPFLPGAQRGPSLPGSPIPFQGASPDLEPTYVRPEPDHTNPAEPVSKPRGTRWLIAAAAAVAALAVTGAVLISTLRPPDGAPTSQTSVTNQAQATQRANDVGRRFALGAGIDDPQLLISEAPQCGLPDYQGTRNTQGQLCVVKWTMINPSGTIRELGDPVLTLTDDRGAAHDPIPAELPASIVPGGRVDGVFVFDLPPQRNPAKLSATMLQGGKQIEVIL